VAQNQPLWKQVDVINHSMGGFVTRAAQKEFKAPFRRVIYVASGHYGFAKAYFALHPATVAKLLDDFIKDFIPGWYWELLKVLPNVWYLQGWLAKLLRTFPSMYELLPDKYYLEEEPGLLLDSNNNAEPQRVVGTDETYFRHNWKLPQELHQKVWYGLKFKEQLGRDLPGKYNMTIYADNLPTYTCATFGTHMAHPERLPIGDGTVVSSSANRATPSKNVVIEANHTQIPNLPETHKVIRRFLLTGK
jgi:pimeloyl-ACP methyl ester carboxylesterase